MTRRVRWLAGFAASLAVAVVVAVVYLARESNPAPDDAPAPALVPAPVPAEVRSPAEERPLAPRPGPPLPDLAPTQDPPSAPSVSTSPATGAPELPPTAASPEPEDNPEIPPEAPQTPEWRLEKTELIASSLARRVERLEVEVREAEARGDREGAAARRVLLERSRRRVVELEREIASLREVVRADGGDSR